MRRICSGVPRLRGDIDAELVDAELVGRLLERERARHQRELADTREQLGGLLGSSTSALVAALDDDLAAVAIATVEAMSAVRRTRHFGSAASETGPAAGIDGIAGAIEDYVFQVARRARSTLAIHLVLEAQARTSRG